MDIETIAAECLTYAQRYRCNLRDAMAEWEGDGPDGSFGLRPAEFTELCAHFHAKGYDMDVERDTRDMTEAST